MKIKKKNREKIKEALKNNQYYNIEDDSIKKKKIILGQMNMNQFSIMLKIKNNLINKNKKKLQEKNNQKKKIKKDYKQTYFIDVIDRKKKDKIENKGEIKDNTSIHYNYIKLKTIK